MGTILGGAFTQYTKCVTLFISPQSSTDDIPRDTWRAVFYFCAALAGVCFLGGMYAIRADPPSTEKDRRVDWLGSFLVTAGLTLIIFILAQGEIAEPKQWGTACMSFQCSGNIVTHVDHRHYRTHRPRRLLLGFIHRMAVVSSEHSPEVVLLYTHPGTSSASRTTPMQPILSGLRRHSCVCRFGRAPMADMASR